MKIQALLYVTLCCWVNNLLHSKGSWCLHLHGQASQGDRISIL